MKTFKHIMPRGPFLKGHNHWPLITWNKTLFQRTWASIDRSDFQITCSLFFSPRTPLHTSVFLPTMQQRKNRMKHFLRGHCVCPLNCKFLEKRKYFSDLTCWYLGKHGINSSLVGLYDVSKSKLLHPVPKQTFPKSKRSSSELSSETHIWDIPSKNWNYEIRSLLFLLDVCLLFNAFLEKK